MERPSKTAGLRHVALFVPDLVEAEAFFVDLMGMEVEWRPDESNVYLTSGNDNLALHAVSEPPAQGQLDHIGYFLSDPEEVMRWAEFLQGNGVTLLTEPRTHRDGAVSFYCLAPGGIRVQLIYHPPIAAADKARSD
jgi:catechol 2,3-dioxygenase-like lactoylglutathione lyase family enzyme